MAVWAVGLYAVGVFVALLSGSRMTLVMLLLVAAGVYWRATWRYKLPFLLVFAAGVAILVSVSNHPLVQERLERTRAMSDWSFAGIDTALSGRLTIWDTAGQMVLDRPLSGVGAGAFASAYDRYSRLPMDMFRRGSPNDQGTGVYHAHQMYVSVAAETGVVGLAGIVAIYVLCMRWYFRASRERRDMAWPFAFGLFVATFPINSQSVMYTHWWFPILLLLLCASLAALSAPEADPSPP